MKGTRDAVINTTARALFAQCRNLGVACGHLSLRRGMGGGAREVPPRHRRRRQRPLPHGQKRHRLRRPQVLPAESRKAVSARHRQGRQRQLPVLQERHGLWQPQGLHGESATARIQALPDLLNRCGEASPPRAPTRTFLIGSRLSSRARILLQRTQPAGLIGRIAVRQSADLLLRSDEPMRSETEAVSHLIGDIYDASINPEKWRPVLQEVCAFVKAGFAILISEDAISSKALVHYSSEDDAEWLDSYFRKYIRLNPMLIPMLNSRVGDIFSMSNIMSHKQFRSTVFFKEWVVPRGDIDTIGAVLDKSATGISVVSAVRLKQQGVVDAGARRRMALIAPHVQRAVAIGRVVDLSYLEASAMSDTLDGFSAAIFLVDGR